MVGRRNSSSGSRRILKCEHFIETKICISNNSYLGDWGEAKMLEVNSSTFLIQFSSVQAHSRVWFFATPWTAAHHHQLPELTQTHVHWVSDAMQLSHPLLSLYPPTFNLSQHQSLFQWVSSSHQVAKVLEFQLQHQSFQWIFRTNFL